MLKAKKSDDPKAPSIISYKEVGKLDQLGYRSVKDVKGVRLEPINKHRQHRFEALHFKLKES